MGILDTGTAALNAVMASCSDEEYTYERSLDGGDTLSLDIEATRSKTYDGSIDADGSAVEYEVWDFLVDSTWMELGEQTLEPAQGDRIIGSDGRLYEVLRDNDGQPFRWSDSAHLRMRIHTKYRGIEG